MFILLAGFAFAQSGEPAPDFKLAGSDGQLISLASLKGKPVVINFWASWCGPCKQEMPAMQTTFDKFKNKFVILAIAVDEPTSTSLKFFKDNKFTYTVLTDAPANTDGADTTKAVKKSYKANQGIPHSFFVDADGVIQAARVGSMDKKTFEYYLGFIGVE